MIYIHLYTCSYMYMYVSSKFIFYDPFINFTLKFFIRFLHLYTLYQVLQQNSFLMHVVHTVAKECITHGQVSYSNIQLQLTLSENLRSKTTRCYG